MEEYGLSFEAAKEKVFVSMQEMQKQNEYIQLVKSIIENRYPDKCPQAFVHTYGCQGNVSDGERLERWGDIILVRPDPQVIWKTPKENPLWYNPHAIYNRSNTGGGSWRVCKKMPDVWQIGFENLKFNIKTMGFKHTGLFPEQAVNWKMTADIITFIIAVPFQMSFLKEMKGKHNCVEKIELLPFKKICKVNLSSLIY